MPQFWLLVTSGIAVCRDPQNASASGAEYPIRVVVRPALSGDQTGGLQRSLSLNLSVGVLAAGT